MTIRKLKELIENLPDDMRIYADDGSNGLFSDNNEFITMEKNNNMCVLQTRKDIDVASELEMWCKYAFDDNCDEQDFWTEFTEMGFVPADFESDSSERMAELRLKDYGLI